MHPLLITPMKHAAAKVGGNQDRMAGRRRAVGFLQIVPGVFPTGVVTDRLLKRLRAADGHSLHMARLAEEAFNLTTRQRCLMPSCHITLFRR